MLAFYQFHWKGRVNMGRHHQHTVLVLFREIVANLAFRQIPLCIVQFLSDIWGQVGMAIHLLLLSWVRLHSLVILKVIVGLRRLHWLICDSEGLVSVELLDIGHHDCLRCTNCNWDSHWDRLLKQQQLRELFLLHLVWCLSRIRFKQILVNLLDPVVVQTGFLVVNEV